MGNTPPASPSAATAGVTDPSSHYAARVEGSPSHQPAVLLGSWRATMGSSSGPPSPSRARLQYYLRRASVSPVSSARLDAEDAEANFCATEEAPSRQELRQNHSYTMQRLWSAASRVATSGSSPVAPVVGNSHAGGRWGGRSPLRDVRDGRSASDPPLPTRALEGSVPILSPCGSDRPRDFLPFAAATDHGSSCTSAQAVRFSPREESGTITPAGTATPVPLATPSSCTFPVPLSASVSSDADDSSAADEDQYTGARQVSGEFSLSALTLAELCAAGSDSDASDDESDWLESKRGDEDNNNNNDFSGSRERGREDVFGADTGADTGADVRLRWWTNRTTEADDDDDDNSSCRDISQDRTPFSLSGASTPTQHCTNTLSHEWVLHGPGSHRPNFAVPGLDLGALDRMFDAPPQLVVPNTQERERRLQCSARELRMISDRSSLAASSASSSSRVSSRQ